MSKKPLSKKEFDALRKKWYAKLRSNGFDDIEVYSLDKIDCYPHFIKRHSLLVNDVYSSEKEEHFRRARIHYEHGKFKDRKHKFMFKLYKDGLSFRQILKRYNENYGESKSIFYIHSHIDAMRDEMNQARHWVTEEINTEEQNDLLVEMLNVYTPDLDLPEED